jgi:hypothetical protein
MFKALKSKKAQLEEEPEKTLDLLDELLFTIHSTRANVLNSRARKYEKRVEKRKEKANMAMRRANRSTFVDETSQDREIDAMFRDVANDFQAPPPREAQRSDNDDDFDDDDEATIEAVSKLKIGAGAASNSRLRKGAENIMAAMESDVAMGNKKKDKAKGSKPPPRLLQGSRDAYNSKEELSHDMKSVQIFESFREELQGWFRTNMTGRNDLDQRGTYADYLNDKYLCQALDPLPPSMTVSQVRRQISGIVEALGSASGNLNVDWAEKKFDALKPVQEPEHMKAAKIDKKEAIEHMEAREELIEEKIYPGRRKALQEQQRLQEEEEERQLRMDYDGGAGAGAGARPGKKSVKFGDNVRGKDQQDDEPRKNNSDKAAEERDRIKKQYEKYKGKKATLDVEGTVDVAKVKENELLQDDIRSLLSTIQNRG